MMQLDMRVKSHDENVSVDVMRMIMAILVIGIHTEPFSFNVWLDRGFGIITRLCVPFFFVVSAYYFFKSKKPISKFLVRIGVMYGLWCLVYLPFDFHGLKTMSSFQILNKYLWIGNEHALWYLVGIMIAILIVFYLHKIFSSKTVLIISIVCLVMGCMGSTWAPMTEKIFGGGYIDLLSIIGTRNGLFYGFPYVALGLWLSEWTCKEPRDSVNLKKYYLGFGISMCLLAVESVIFVLFFNTKNTVLWVSVLPATYFLFSIVLNLRLSLKKEKAVLLRKISSLMYVSHGLFIMCFSKLGTGPVLFGFVTVSSLLFSIGIILLSKYVKALKWLY